MSSAQVDTREIIKALSSLEKFILKITLKSYCRKKSSFKISFWNHGYQGSEISHLQFQGAMMELIALYDCNGDCETELSFRKGQKLSHSI